MRAKRTSQNEQLSKSRHIDLITALEEIESREKIRLKVAIPYKVAEKLDRFLREKGLPKRHGLPVLIRDGLSDESEEELQKLKLEKEKEMGHLWGTYCTMRFQAYEDFMENKAITISLNFLLSENRSLKERLENVDLKNCVSKDEWDDWDEAKLNDLYRKYVFTNRL
jgi:metal-responsive CopG/Arc/MetJ family transcriptional regulator